jgi:hypothetical protein
MPTARHREARDIVREATPNGAPREADARNRRAWSTPRSAAFFAAIIVLALILARLLAPLLRLAPG